MTLTPLLRLRYGSLINIDLFDRDLCLFSLTTICSLLQEEQHIEEDAEEEKKEESEETTVEEEHTEL